MKPENIDAYLDTVPETQCAAIQRQREHHGHIAFQDEYRRLLDENQVSYDERYVWE